VTYVEIGLSAAPGCSVLTEQNWRIDPGTSH